MLLEKDWKVSYYRRLFEIFDEHFIYITKTLNLKASTISITTCFSEIIDAFNDHSSTIHFFFFFFFFLREEQCQFKYQYVGENEVTMVILNMAKKDEPIW